MKSSALAEPCSWLNFVAHPRTLPADETKRTSAARLVAAAFFEHRRGGASAPLVLRLCLARSALAARGFLRERDRRLERVAYDYSRDEVFLRNRVEREPADARPKPQQGLGIDPRTFAPDLHRFHWDC